MAEPKPNANWRALHGVVLFALMAGCSLAPSLHVWPLLWVAPLAAYFALVAIVPPLRATFPGFRFGRMSKGALIATLVIAAGACAVLAGYDAIAKPDVSGHRTFLPVSQLGGIVVAGVVFSILNATFEEIVFRGILFDSIAAQWNAPLAVVATAAIFGFAHTSGYPSGVAGAVLAGVFGLALGWLRAFTGGIGLPVAAHIAADATIYILLVRAGAV